MRDFRAGRSAHLVHEPGTRRPESDGVGIVAELAVGADARYPV